MDGPCKEFLYLTSQFTNSSIFKLRLGLWILAFTLVINLIAYFNPNDNKNIKTEDDVFAQRSVEDLIREKG